MNFIKVIDDLYDELENNKNSVLASKISKDVYLLYKKIKMQLSTSMMSLRLNLDEERLLSAYLKDTINYDKTEFCKCDRCHKEFPNSMMQKMGSPKGDGSEILVCPVCVLSSPIHKCHECHQFFHQDMYKPFPKISFDTEANELAYNKYLEDNSYTDYFYYLAKIVKELCPDLPDSDIDTIKKTGSIQAFDAPKTSLNKFFAANPMLLNKITKGLITPQQVKKLSEYTEKDAICYHCLDKLFPSTTDVRNIYIESDFANLYFVSTTSQDNWYGDADITAFREKAKTSLLNVINGIEDNDLEATRINKFNFLGFTHPLDALMRRKDGFSWVENQLMDIYRQITGDKNYYKNIFSLMNKSESNIIEVTRANNSLDVLLVLEHKGEINAEELEENIYSSFNVPLICPWTKNKEWVYFSVKNRKPYEDYELLKSGKLPYCSCTVNGKIENLDIEDDEEAELVSITFTLTVNIENKQVHNPKK